MMKGKEQNEQHTEKAVKRAAAPEKKTRVLIAVPTFENCRIETMKSIYDLAIPPGVEAELEFIAGYTVAQARNRAVALSLERGFDYTLFVDSDVVLPRELLISLMQTGAPIATGWYIKKIPGRDGITELYAPTADGSESMANVMEKDMPKEPQLIAVTGCGFGCTLVHNEVFRAMGDSCWFEYIERPGKTCSEDLTFCIKARNLRYGIVALSSLRCPHVGRFIF